MTTWRLYRAFTALFLLSLTSCKTPPCRQWICKDAIVENPCFNSGRLILAPESDSCHLELEISRSRTGIRMYVNVLLLQAAPLPDDLTKSSIEIIFEGGQTETVYPYILKGGQRLLLAGDTTDKLLQILLLGQTFAIRMGRQQIDIVIENFPAIYQHLMEIPITEKEE